jgi:hypothetical protein
MAGPVPGRLPFKAEILDDSSDNAPWCLCPGGGTFTYNEDGTLASGPVYHFSLIAGSLPGGQKLNPETGCIEGIPDPEHPGSDTVKFRVVDVASSEHADVECGIKSPPCPPVVPTANAFL